ncbi:MAG: hypothetical protein HZB83_05600 [Deltaproteobacteria bacterium]|nr:hypothetical protein [Deltaproteobacteria bacterium]
MREILKNTCGASVVAVVIIMGILVVSGVVFVSLFSTGIETSTAEVSSTRALYGAEGAMEAAIGHLRMSPVSANWVWNDGYKDKPIGRGAADVEVLEYENRDGTLVGSNACERFESITKITGANPPSTVYMTLSWDTAANLGLELYDNYAADCNNPAASAGLIASSLTSNKPEIVRYRIQTGAAATFSYTARVTGTAGTAYRLRIAHPDETSFSTANQCGQPDGVPYDECMRAIISIGKVGAARREIFGGFNR